MALFQTRKTRTSRAAEIKPSSSLVRRSVSSLHNRAIAARIALCVAAILATVVVVQGWKVPFPYRLGDRSDNGITAKIDFERPNPPATELARLEAENRVPPFFVRESGVFDGLVGRLRVGLNDVAQANSLSDLSPQTRAAFGMVLPEAGATKPNSAAKPAPPTPPAKSPPTTTTQTTPAQPPSEPPASGAGSGGSSDTANAGAAGGGGAPKSGDTNPTATNVTAPNSGDAKPSDAGSVDPKPIDVKPTDPKPADPKPIDIKPNNVKPGVAKPVEVKPGDEMNQDFVALRDAVRLPMSTAGNRIDDMISEFERFLSHMRSAGLADPAELDRLKIARDQQITVVATTPTPVSLLLMPEDVLLSELLKETGAIGKSWDLYEKLLPIKPQLERWLMSQAPVSLRYDGAATQKARREAREKVQPVTIRFNAGNVLLPAGRPIDEETLSVLESEYEAVERSISTDQRVARMLTVFVMLCVLAAVNGYYVVHNEPRLVRSSGRLTVYLLCLVGAVALGRYLSYDPWRAEVIPLVAVGMVFAVAYNQVLATLLGFTLALVVTISTGGDLGQFIVLMSAVATAVISLSSVPSRSTIIKIGFGTGLAYFLVACGLGIVQSQSTYEVWKDTTLLFSAFRGAGWCLVAGYLVAGSLPFIEKTFGVVTDISLLEMSDISHPLLQELVRRAPGTYNHSIAVATIGETAADRIGANGLLVRVGAYYHDIGKMLKPQYFIENITEGMTSRHKDLAPAMSTLIIIGHVKDGVDLARRHDLPQPLIDFIEQHHGTTLVEYFFREAKTQADQTLDHKRDVEESAYRYPGPKPQTRELGVMMIADAVESATRALGEPTPKRIEGLVHGIIMKRLLDGQFDECNLTLNELRIVEDSLVKSLIGIHHGRIKYPDQRSA